MRAGHTSDRKPLAGKVALVTGGGKGIGRSIAFAFAKAGAHVGVIAHHNLTSADQTVADVRADGGQASSLRCDITNRASVETAVASALTWADHIDILVNNAGLGIPGRLENLSEADWDRVFAVNTKGTFLMAAAVARHMISQGTGGAIVNIAGASAHRSYPGNGAYGPAKAAVVSLTVQMALEWSGHGIRVNGISPGPIREPNSGWETREPALAAEVERLPLKRAGRPEDVAQAALYLASDDAAYVTGHMLIVDGGSVATWYVTG